MECKWCGQSVTMVDYFGTGTPVLADWTGAYECPGRTITPSPHGAHEV